MFGKPKINRAEFCFDTRPPLSEDKAIGEVVKFFKLAKRFTDDVDISASYGRVPGVDESFAINGCSQELFRFVVTRAILLGFSSKEIDKIEPLPFTVAGVRGVVIAGYMKDLKNQKVKV